MTGTAPGLGSQPPAVLLPEPGSMFSHRARRLRQLSQGSSSLAGFLGLIADLAEAQHHLAHDFSVAEPQAASRNMPPLDVTSWRPGPIWCENLRAIADRVQSSESAVAALPARIRRASHEEMDSWASSLLAADFDRLDTALAPFLAAALQVHWTVAASRLDAARLASGHPGSHCPVCGFLPVASVLQTGGAVQGLRYLVCGLCGSEWNRPRIHCVHCGSGRDVAYFCIDGAGGAVRAEACAACNTYVKLMNREKDSFLDPFADDLATLPLDLLMSEEGYRRLGFNPLLIPGH